MITRGTLAAIALILTSAGVLTALLQAAEDPPTELYVRTTPAGATLFLDGKKLGAAPNIFEVAPGRHELLAVLDGYRSARRDIDVPATRIERVILTLESIAFATNATDGLISVHQAPEPDPEGLPIPGYPTAEELGKCWNRFRRSRRVGYLSLR